MLDRLETLEREHAELQARLGDPELIADQTRYTQATRRYSELGDIVDVGGRRRGRSGQHRGHAVVRTRPAQRARHGTS